MNYQTMHDLSKKLREQADNLEKSANDLLAVEISIEDFPSDILFDFDWPLEPPPWYTSPGRVIVEFRTVGVPRTDRAKKLQERLINLIEVIRKSNFEYGITSHPSYSAVKQTLKNMGPAELVLRMDGTLYLCGTLEQWAGWIKEYPKLKILNYSKLEEALEKELKEVESRYQVLLKAKHTTLIRSV